MCEYINDQASLSVSISRERPLIGKPLNDVLTWKRAFSPAGCYCDADSRMHKWGLVLEVLHFALARREQERLTPQQKDTNVAQVTELQAI
jgi:hypothetical protein